MSQHLQKDICDLGHVGADISEVQPGVVEERLFPALRYACCYWVHHVHEGDVLSSDVEAVSAFLHEHLLHWLEALSLMERLRDAILMLRDLELIMVRKLTSSPNIMSRANDGGLKESAHPDGRAFVNDAKRFVQASSDLIEEAPLQTYCSALVFTPLNSLVRQQFSYEFPPWITRLPEVEKDWSALVQTFEASPGSDSYQLIAFSPDGHLAVSDTHDVRFLDSVTGASTGRINVGDYEISSLSFSLDGKLLACSAHVAGTELHDILLYDTVLRLKRGVLRTTATKESELAFSPDGQLLAAATQGRRIEIWDTQTALLRESLYMRLDITNAEFSADGHVLACGSENFITEFWDFQFRTVVSSVVSKCRGTFSPVDKLFAYVPAPGRVGLWNVDKDALHYSVSDDFSDQVLGFVFSPDGKSLVCWADTRCSVWDVESGTHRYRLTMGDGL
jgi:WD40 repeat protein